MDKDLNVRPKTIKLLEENWTKASQHWIWQWFFGYDTKSTGNNHKNNKIDKLDFMKI